MNILMELETSENTRLLTEANKNLIKQVGGILND